MKIVREKVEVFIAWTKRKLFHHFDETEAGKQKYFREKEIWWTALGQNIGYEVDGKHELFERPVLIIKKYSHDMCFVLPLTTQLKTPIPWYHIHIFVEGKKSAVNITQGRSISVKRLLRRVEVLDSKKYIEVIEVFINQFISK